MFEKNQSFLEIVLVDPFELELGVLSELSGENGHRIFHFFENFKIGISIDN